MDYIGLQHRLFFFFLSDDTNGLLEFVKITTSAVNAKVSKVKERLGNISLEVRRISSASFSGDFLTDANRAGTHDRKTI